MAMQYFVYDFRGFRSQRKATHTPTHIGVIGDPGEETGDANTTFGDPLVFEASDATSHSASDPLRTLQVNPSQVMPLRKPQLPSTQL